MARERTGSGSAKGMAAGMQTQTVLLAPPSTPRMTLHPMRGLWHSSICHIALDVYLCILLLVLLAYVAQSDKGIFSFLSLAPDAASSIGERGLYTYTYIYCTS